MNVRHTFFWVGVTPEADPMGTVPNGQMYVERVSPPDAASEEPIVLIHGGGGQGLDWLGTPDGRPGWAQLLASRGHDVYVVDRPGHGRSPYHPDLLGPMFPPATYEMLAEIFTPDPEGDLGRGHTEWPGGRLPGDQVMDQFMASAGPMRAELAAAHALEQRCLAELLDQTGPAVVFSHSAGGPAGFLAAEARPDAVTRLVAIEPIGPPFLKRPEIGLSLDWGLAAAPFEFDPPVDDAGELDPDQPRRLVNLSRVPITLVTAPSSMVGLADPATAAFLRAAGCEVDHIRLAEHGFPGNGHGMMMERNSSEVLELLLARLASA
jgi:pimeloyl-ACP methyl ester carboxylesterase